MAACTFFGHRDAPTSIAPILRSVLTRLIVCNDVRLFYVGNHGNFDAMVHQVLQELAQLYPITFHVVLAYRPKKEADTTDFSDTILPDGIETLPIRFAIEYRNKWMIQRSKYAITYVTTPIASGAARFKALCEKQEKTVIEIADRA